MSMSLETNPTAPARRPASATASSSDEVSRTTLIVGIAGDDPARRLEPVHAGHRDVHHDDVGVVVEAELDALAAALGLGDHDVALVLERVAHDAARHRVVVDQHDASALLAVTRHVIVTRAHLRERRLALLSYVHRRSPRIVPPSCGGVARA